jgi:large conductance mechanosensitive channel
MLKSFRDFVMKGNVLDLAVAVIMGAAFGKIVTSFTNDILMPPIGMLLGGVDFANLFLSLDGGAYPSLAAAQAAGAPTLNYGIFLNTIIDFIIVAFALFLLIRAVTRLQAPKPTAAPTTRDCPFCATTISLAARRCPHCTSELAHA